MAVKQGDPNAMFALAGIYERGLGVVKSLKKAAELYALAVNQGHATAQYNLGNAYANGEGVAQSYEKALELWTLAANQGDADAQDNLGILYIMVMVLLNPMPWHANGGSKQHFKNTRMLLNNVKN